MSFSLAVIWLVSRIQSLPDGGTGVLPVIQFFQP